MSTAAPLMRAAPVKSNGVGSVEFESLSRSSKSALMEALLPALMHCEVACSARLVVLTKSGFWSMLPFAPGKPRSLDVAVTDRGGDRGRIEELVPLGRRGVAPNESSYC